MAAKSPVLATQEWIARLESKAVGSDRVEADRARAILLTLRGWTSPRIAEGLWVREDTVRLGAAHSWTKASKLWKPGPW